MRPVAFNDVMILVKDHGEYKSAGGIILPETMASDNMMEIPPPYTGTIDSIGVKDDEYEIGDRVAFSDIGGIYIKFGETEYVVINKGMIIGKL